MSSPTQSPDVDAQEPEDDIEIDQLISLMHSRPPLWDKFDPNYHNRILKTRLWEEIYGQIYFTWEEYNAVEKKIKDKKFLELFVRGCRMDMHRARTKFEAFCLSRSRHRDLFEYRSLNEPPLNDVCNFMDIISLPKLTDEGYRVSVFRIKPEYPESAADIAATVRAVLLVSDARMHDEKLIAGDVFIWDVTEVRGSLVARVATAFGTIRRGIQLAQAAYPQRLKRVHVVVAPPFLASSLQLMRSLVNEKVRRRYYLNSKVDELLDHIPGRVLPAEWGGQEESIDVLAKRWRRRIDELRDYLRDLSDLTTATRATHNDNDIYGTVGAFRKLDID